MKDGFVKAAGIVPELKPGDCAFNAEAAARAVEQAAELGVQVVCLPELCLTGVTCGDLFLHAALLDAAESALFALAERTEALDIFILAGLPIRHAGAVYNCAAAIKDGKILGLVPNIDPAPAERRFFAGASAANEFIRLRDEHIPFGAKLLFTCDSLPDCVVACEAGNGAFSPRSLAASHALAGATIILNPAAHPAGSDNAANERYIAADTERLLAGYVSCSAGEGESSGDGVYSGAVVVIENGEILARKAPFEQGIALGEIDTQMLTYRRRAAGWELNNAGYTAVSFALKKKRTELTRLIDDEPFEVRPKLIVDIQARGLKRRMEHIGAKTAVLGISGGLDSTMALHATARAFDLMGRTRTGITACVLPCFGTTERTRNNALALCRHYGATIREIDISDTVRSHFSDIGQDESDYSAAYENAQARERTQVLMDIANMQNGLVVGTGDLSELALGWATYNGDHMSMYNVNAGLPKTVIRHVLKAIAGQEPAFDVLYDILDTPVSPELLPSVGEDSGQATEELVGPYVLHDFFLWHFLRNGSAPAKILRLAECAFCGEYNRATILKWLRVFFRRFFAQQYKRSCLPDGPRIYPVSLSPRGGLSLPSDLTGSLWMAEMDALG